MEAGTARVTTVQMNRVINTMQKSATKSYLLGCSFQECVMLASLICCIRRSGLSAIPWAEVRFQDIIILNKILIF